MKKKNKDELLTKFDKVLKLSKNNETGISSIAFSQKEVLAYGLGPKLFEPNTAIYYVNINGSSELNGHIQKDYLNDTTEDTKTILAIDIRNSVKPVLFLSRQNSIKKITKKTDLHEEEMVLLYWEYGPYSLFLFSSQDPISKETLLECVFNNTLDSQKSNRYLFLSLLPTEEAHLLENKFKKSFNDSFLQG